MSEEKLSGVVIQDGMHEKQLITSLYFPDIFNPSNKQCRITIRKTDTGGRGELLTIGCITLTEEQLREFLSKTNDLLNPDEQVDTEIPIDMQISEDMFDA
jgi:hypothetical protein